MVTLRSVGLVSLVLALSFTAALLAMSSNKSPGLYAAYGVHVEIVQDWIEKLSELGINTTSVQYLLNEAMVLANGGNLTGAIHLLNEAINQSASLLSQSNLTSSDELRESLEETVTRLNKSLSSINATPVVNNVVRMKLEIERELNTTNIDLELRITVNNTQEVIKILENVKSILVSVNASPSAIGAIDEAIALVNSTRQSLIKIEVEAEGNSTNIEIHGHGAKHSDNHEDHHDEINNTNQGDDEGDHVNSSGHVPSNQQMPSQTGDDHGDHEDSVGVKESDD